MIKLDETVVKALVNSVKEAREQVVSEDGEQVRYFLDDLSISCNSEGEFLGAIFDLLDREFYISSTFELFVREESEEGRDEIYTVEDVKLIKAVSVYLTWREKVLTSIDV